jgi:hypothetical protein
MQDQSPVIYKITKKILIPLFNISDTESVMGKLLNIYFYTVFIAYNQVGYGNF